jgi:hypothetical protein
MRLSNLFGQLLYVYKLVRYVKIKPPVNPNFSFRAQFVTISVTFSACESHLKYAIPAIEVSLSLRC